MTRITKRTVIPHGVVFLYDPSMIVDVPQDTGAAPILRTGNCISIWTLGEYDGEVLLTLSDEMEDVHGRPAFESLMRTDGGQLAFNDSGVNPLLELEVSGKWTRVAIFTNDELYPDSVMCLVSAGDASP